MKSDGIIITSPTHFFDEHNINTPPNSTVCKYDVKKIPHIIRSIFNINPTMELGDNDLVIHIRSGDIFIDNPHPTYYQPPLSFYTDILNAHTFDTIYLVSEDNLNPCVNALLKQYPEIKYKQQTLKEDINLILSAKNVIHSNGTFTVSLLYFSQNIQHTYKYNFPKNYISGIYPWRNTKEQRDFMLTFRE